MCGGEKMSNMPEANGKKRKEQQYTVTFEGLEWLEHYVLTAEISLIQEYFSEEIKAVSTTRAYPLMDAHLTDLQAFETRTN